MCLGVGGMGVNLGVGVFKVGFGVRIFAMDIVCGCLGGVGVLGVGCCGVHHLVRVVSLSLPYS